MLLLMTCNGWVVLVCILGLFSGYLCFRSPFVRKSCHEGNYESMCC